MALRPLNSIAGFSTGDPAITVIQANGDVTTVNLTANGVSNLGNVGNVKITGGNAGEYLSTDGLGNLAWDSIGNLSSNRAAVMPYLIPTGESYIVNENFQGLYSQTITIDGELEVDGILIEVPISFDASPTQVLFAENGNPTGRTGFTFDAISGNLAIPGNISITGSIVPTADDNFDLGNSIRRWRNGYFGGNTIYLDSASISVNNAGYLVLTNEYGGEFIVSGNSTSGSNSLVNGNSNVIVNADGNVSFGINNTSNVLVVSSSGATVTGNLVANGVKTDNLYYANGQPWDLQQPAGSNTQIQFNNQNDFGASANFTFNSATNTLGVTGNITVTTGKFTGDAGGLSNIVGANVTGAVAYATTANSVAGANVSGAVAYATTANSVAGANVSGQVANALVAGTVYTNAQPNITSVGTLSSVSVSGNASVGGIKTDNYYYANGNPVDFQQPAGSNKQIQFNNNNDFGASANLAFDTSINNLNLNANLVVTNGVITSSGNISAPFFLGNVVGNISGNIVVPGNNTAVIFNNEGNAGASDAFTFNSVSNTVTTKNLSVANDATITGNLTVNGNLVYVNVEELAIEDPIINLNTGPNGVPPVSNSGKDVGTALNYYDTQARIAFMGWDTSNAEFAFGSQSTISSEVVTFNTLGNVRAQTFKGNVAQANTISGNYLISNSGCVSVNGAMIAFNSGTGAAGIFSSLATDINFGLSANIVMGNSASNVTVQGNLIANGNITGNLITGTLATAAQPNVTSLGTLTGLTVNGNITSNNATANTVTTNSTIGKRGNVAVTVDTVIDSFSASAYRTAKYVIKSKNDDGYESLEVLLIHNNINSYITVYAAINDGGGNTVTITTGISSGNVELRATGLATNTVVNLIGTYVPD